MVPLAYPVVPRVDMIFINTAPKVGSSPARVNISRMEYVNGLPLLENRTLAFIFFDGSLALILTTWMVIPAVLALLLLMEYCLSTSVCRADIIVPKDGLDVDWAMTSKIMLFDFTPSTYWPL